MEWLNDQVAAWWPSSDSGKGPEASDRAEGHGQTDLSRDQLLHFFDVGQKQLACPNFRQKLKDAQLLQQDLEDIITEAQRRLFRDQGIDGDFGVAYLGKVNTKYKHDDEVMSAFLRFVSLEEDAISEAELSPELYQQNRRLLEIAKGHAAEAMERLKDLSPDEQKQFIANQMQAVDKLRRQNQTQAATASAMTDAEREQFFRAGDRR